MKRLIIVLICLLYTGICQAFNNDLRTLFTDNKAIICGINIRNFNAQDTNKNEIIDKNEISGNFINAVDRLDELKTLGINTIHVLPITPVGKLKALGTAGSVYAISDFASINPQIIDKSSELSPIEQAKFFVNECHKRNIRVIIDLPSCGSYDLFLLHPELFIKDEKHCSIVPTDWTDVRLFDTGNNERLNNDLIEVHKQFVDMLLEIKADGIRADVATIKPQQFWIEIINYARSKDPEFLFLAEASDSWREPPSKYAEFTPYDKLLEAGFDGYYGSFFALKDWKKTEDLIEHIKFNKKLFEKYKAPKSVILSFTTHDEVSPIVIHGSNFSNMISWLEAILPYNPYCIDGFYNGDDYLYPWANTSAENSETDDNTYFVHRGKLDIFNFSRKSLLKNNEVFDNYKNAMDFRNDNIDFILNSSINTLKCENPNIITFEKVQDKRKLIFIGNTDYNKQQNKIKINVKGINKNSRYSRIVGNACPKISRNKINIDLEEGEVIILEFILK